MKNANFRMKKESIILVSILMLCFHSGAQNLSWAWTFVSTTSVINKGIVVDEDGNTVVLLTLLSSGTVDCDPGAATSNLTSAGSNDIILCKYNPQGEFIWAKQIGGTGNDVGDNLTLDADGNIYFSGVFENTVDVDPGPDVHNLSAVSSSSSFVIKLDSSGNMTWVRFYPIGISRFNIDGNDNLLISGTFQGTRDFDPGTGIFNMTSAGSSDVYVAKLDDSGDLLWAGQIGGVQFDNVFSMDMDNDGNVYLTGIFNFNADFDPGVDEYSLTSQGNTDIFVEKINSDGTFGWAFQIGGVDNDYARSIKFDPSNYLYITGLYKGTVDFDPGPAIFNQTSIALNNMYISKLDLDGNLVWAKQLACATNISESAGAAIVLDASDNIIIAGQFAGTVDFDPGAAASNLTSTGGFDLYICKLNSEGELIGLTTLGSAANEGSDCIAVDNQNEIYLGGYFNGTLDFDSGPEVFNMTSSGLNNRFIAKATMTPLGVGMEDQNHNHLISVYPNPSKGVVRVEIPGFSHEPVSVTVTNISGQKVEATVAIDKNNLQLQLNEPAGIYFINLQNSTYNLTKKIILQ